jgi:hypothetical protein
LIHSPFSNFLCCVTIVKVSSIWFLQWFPFSYNVHYYFGELFFSIFIYIFWLPGSVLNINYLTFNLLCHQLFTTITVDEPAPGLKTIFSFKVPDQRSGKVSYLIVYLLSLSLSLVFLRMQRTYEFMLSEIPLLCIDSQICKCWPLWFLLILIIIF